MPLGGGGVGQGVGNLDDEHCGGTRWPSGVTDAVIALVLVDDGWVGQLAGVIVCLASSLVSPPKIGDSARERDGVDELQPVES